eukprot:gene26721-4291_t
MQNGAAKVTGTLMSLTFQEPSEENPGGTWHADTTFIAAKVVPLDMTTTYKPEERLTLAFDVGFLQGIFEEEVDTIPLVAAIVPTDTSPPIAVSATFPYCGCDTHKDRLLCNGAPILASNSQAQPTQVSSTLRDTMHACRVPSGVKGQACGIMVKLTNMRQHVAMHMLRGDCEVVCGVTPTADEACRFCGMIRSHGECSVKLAKGSGSYTKIVSQCPYANNNLRYGSITNQSKFAPSTNRPVECKICKAVEGNSKEQYCVWSNQYLDRLQKAHPGHVVSDQDKNDYAISAAEIESVVSYGVKTKADSKAVIRWHVKRLKMVVAYRMGLNASQYHWNCSWRGDPWKIKGGKLGLIFVYTRVQTPIRRGVLRTAYSQYNQDFDVVFAVGFPDPVSYIVERTCQEQEVEGDLILVNCKETHNDGKMYHTIIHLAELLNNMWKRGYKQIIKLDDDSYAHLPNMATYLTEQKGQELAANKYAMWGPRLDHYYFGSLNGFSIDLFLEVVPKIEPKYIGGHFEDWLLGFYMRIFGPREIFDIAMNNSLWTHFPNEQRNVTFMAEDLRQRPMVCFFHCKAIEDWQLLISVVKEAKENSSKTSRKIMWKRLSL